MDYHFSELFKWLIFAMLLILLIGSGMFFYVNNQYGSFQDQAGKIISTNGGVKPNRGYSSEKQLKELQSDYHNRFLVRSDTPAAQPYGTPINFDVQYNVKGLPFGLKVDKVVHSSTTSRVGVD